MFDFPKKYGNNIFVAVNFEQYRQSPEQVKGTIVEQAQARLERGLQGLRGGVGADWVELPFFFNDVYLLRQTGVLAFHPEWMRPMQQLAAHPRVRTEFLNTLKAQDAALDSQEVLASLVVGATFDYHLEGPFRAVFNTLSYKHNQLIEAEKQREAQRKAQEKAAAQEARRRAKSWEPPKSNVGKSPEWVAAQEKIAGLWAAISTTLPQGIERETEAADLAYFSAGFGLLKQEFLNAPATNRMANRAMLEYLIPQIWRQPRMVRPFFQQLENEWKGRVAPTSLEELGVLPKVLFIPPGPGRVPKSQIRKIHDSYQHAMHPDVANLLDVNKDLQPHIDVIHAAVNNNWDQVRPLGSK